MNLSEMTQQQIYDTVVAGLAEQGFKQSRKLLSSAPGVSTTCAYRGDNGLKCAAGHIIPDSEYKPGMEGAIAASLDFFKENVSQATLKFIDSLQQAHDGGSNPETMKEELCFVGNSYELEIPKVLRD
jgi:hypothetical protein